MITSKIENLIVKFVNRSATSTDLDELTTWISVPKNKQIFKDYVQVHYAITYSTSNLDANQIKEHLLHEIQKEKSIFYKYKLQSVFKYAAIAILFLGIGYLYQSGVFTSDPSVIIASENITLQLDTGKIEIIKENGLTEVINTEGNVVATQNGNQLVYNNVDTKETLVYNTLKVPYGKRFVIQLSDGTKVHLNAGTSLKYPVKFIEGENRQVFLYGGEAYFSVAKDENHPFIVNSDEINVRVLGTQFNITSYPEDSHINTVLVEGSVSVYDKEQEYNSETAILLKPGFKAAWDKSSNQIEIEEADTEMHTAWINGKIIFRHTPFKSIIKKLERHYNVVIVNNNKMLDEEQFTGSFDVETIEKVFETLNANYKIDYTINNNQIIIN